MNRIDEFNQKMEDLNHSDPVQVQAMIELIEEWLLDGTDSEDFRNHIVSVKIHLLLDLWEINQDASSFEKAIILLKYSLTSNRLHIYHIVAFERVFVFYLNLYFSSKAIFNLDEAIFWGEYYCFHAIPSFSNYVININNLGSALGDRYEHRGSKADLDKSIELLEEALRLTEVEDKNRSSRLNNLGLALGHRYALRGSEADLDRSIELLEEALRLTAEGDRDRPALINNLGNALADRYARRGNDADLDKRIELHKEALQLTAEEDIDRPGWLNNLGNALADRYARRGNDADLDKRIELHEEALRLTVEGDRHRPGLINNLGNALADRYTRRGNDADLDKSIGLYEEALGLTAEGDRNRSGWLNNLGNALRDRYALRRSQADLDRSIELHKEALRLTAEGDRDRPALINNLGNALADRYARRGNKNDAKASWEGYNAALKILPDSALLKPGIYSNLGNLCLDIGEYQAAMEAYESMAKNLEILRSASSNKHDREKMISDYARGFADLVFCCLKLNQPEKALRYAEAAKSRALVDALHNQVTDLSNFATDDEDLQADLDELQKLQQEINWLLNQLGAGDETVGWTDPDITRFRRPPEEISAELNQKREKEETLWQNLERKAPVFAITVSAPPFELQDAINLAKKEKAALISYYKHSGGWVAFVVVSGNLYIKEIEGVEELLYHYQSAFSNLHSKFARLLLIYVLEHAWSVLIQPLMAWLPEKGSNLVIAPFAGLHHLPFAAFTNPNNGSYLVDHYHLKAATSLGTLKAMHTQAEILPELRAPSRAMTAVGYAGATVTPSYLHAVETEVVAISGLFGPEPPLTGHNAKIENVLRQAPGSEKLHIACHGMFDPEQPQLSGLMLEDGWLTVRDVMTRMNLSGTEMVVMSSCLSGLTKISQGEELTGLLTAFISSRAKAVVSSLWKVDDQSTEKLMVRFYELINQGMQKHDALRQAQLEIRQQPDWSHPYYWAPFFLTGVG